MTRRGRITLAVVLTVVLLGGAAVYCVLAIADFQSRQTPAAAQTSVSIGDGAESSATVVFRNTDTSNGYGLVARVPADDPLADRTFTDVQCDRVYAASTAADATETICLRIDRGILTTFSANLLDDSGAVTKTWPLPGLPSRARLSADGALVGFTAFVTGESYGSIDFSTATQISSTGAADATGGTDYGNLETFALLIDGQPNTAVDRNFWGVTFTDDDNVFYATAATGGNTWLVRGDLADRTLTSVRETAECPSVSPDGTRIAYKKNVSTGVDAHWAIAVLDLATDKETLMPDDRNIDDQVEWLDDSTLLYAMPGTDAGDTDVWSIPADGSGASAVFIPHASSPSVVRR
jgi:hypothetical protein